MGTGTFVIVGLGNIGRLLIRMLSREFRLVCIDQDGAALQAVSEGRVGTVTVQGDATSRLVLEKAGVAQADTVVITTSDETVNLEVARVLHDHFPGTRVLSVGITGGGIAELEELGIEVESIFARSATGLRNRLEHRTKTVHGIGVGKNEILEVEIDPNSRLVNKPLGRLRPRNWRFGLIYRNGNIIVPTGSTTLKGRDRVILLGEPKVLKIVAERLTLRFLDFPLEYGDTAVVLFPKGADEAFSGEVAYLASTLPLERFLFLVPRGGAGPGALLSELLADRSPATLEFEPGTDPGEAIARALEEFPCNPGLLLPHPSLVFSGTGSERRAKRLALDLFERCGCPLLLARGTFPYERVAVPCLEHDLCQHALEDALEISAGLYNDIEALLVQPSPYIAGEEELTAYKRTRKAVSDLALAYKASVRKVELQGNPVHAIRNALGDYRLLVTEIGAIEASGWRALFHPDVPWHIVRRAPLSTLLIPAPETVL